MTWHQQDHMQTICTLLQTDNHTNTSSLNFYTPDALPDPETTVSRKALLYYLLSIYYNHAFNSEKTKKS